MIKSRLDHHFSKISSVNLNSGEDFHPGHSKKKVIINLNDVTIM